MATSIFASGVSAAGALASVTMRVDTNVFLTGVTATGVLGTVMVWGEIPVGPSAGNWVRVPSGSSGGWLQVPSGGTPNWVVS